MADFPYVQATTRIPKLFTELHERGRPDKVTQRWLTGAGFTSSSDRPFINLLRFLGIIDQGGTPTADYDRLKQTGWKGELAAMVQSAYADVFQALPNANSRTKKELENQFRAIDTGASSRIITMKVSTFSSLVDVADFSASSSIPESPSSQASDAPQATADTESATSGAKGPVSVNINISLEIPVTDKPEVYEHLFRSMSEHLGELVGSGGH
ncbi:MAG: DUF5343 domain-containing protein [Chloroflexota bacterium]|nr:DUF5343 domain-containing protein [Chloroflexota bacterium]